MLYCIVRYNYTKKSSGGILRSTVARKLLLVVKRVALLSAFTQNYARWRK